MFKKQTYPKISFCLKGIFWEYDKIKTIYG